MDYIVKRGDTLSALARRHGTTVDAIMDANRGRITDRDRIYTGDTITIPTAAKAAKRGAGDVQASAPSPVQAPVGDASTGADAVTAAAGAAPVLPPPSFAAPVVPPYVTTSHQANAVVTTYVGEDNAFEQRVVELVNDVRRQHGLAPLAYDVRLDHGAERHTAHQAAVGRMGHDGIGDGTPQERMYAAGWLGAWGENAAVGQTSPEQVVREWMASPGHRANILNPDFGFLAVGYDLGRDGRPYWTQSFGA